MRHVLAALLGCAPLAAPASAMTLRVTERERPMGTEHLLFLSGEIMDGDADRLAAQMARIPFGPGSVARVILSSPGGSLVDGLAIGRAIAALPTTVTTDVGAGETRVSDCASACVFAFLGGHYRSIRPGSRLGVHQFYPTDDTGMTGAEGVQVGQVLSAEIVAFLAEMRVDPGFYTLMTQPLPEDILWVSAEDLDRFGVTTGAVRDQRVEYRNADGFFYLTLWQEGMFGENKLLLSCNDAGSVAFMAYLQPPDLGPIATDPHTLSVSFDGTPEAPAMWDLIGTDETWAISLFTLTPDQMARLATARSFGARLTPDASPDTFFGFDFDLSEGRDDLLDMIEGCRLQQEMGFSAPTETEPLPLPLSPRESRFATRRTSP